MSFTVNAHELFWLDLAEVRIYYESVSFDLGDRFYEAFMEKDIHALSDHVFEPFSSYPDGHATVPQRVESM